MRLRIINFRLFVLLSLWSTGNFNSTAQTYQQQSDSLFTLLDTVQHAERRIDLLNEISYNFRRLSPDSVIRYAQQALEEAEAISYKNGEAIACKNMGIALYKTGLKLDEAILYYDRAIRVAAEIEDYYTQAACNSNIGLIYVSKGELNSAIAAFLKGIKIFDDHFDTEERLKALMLCNIGYCYSDLEEYDKALEYYNSGLEMAERNGHKSILSIYLDNVGVLYLRQENYQAATAHFDRAISFQRELGDFQSMLQTSGLKIDLLLKQNKLEAARAEAFDAIKVGKERKFLDNRLSILLKLAEIESQLGNNSKAINYANEVLEGAKIMENFDHERDGLGALARFYEQSGNYKAALDHLKWYDALKDTLSKQQRIEYTASLDAKYRTKDKEAKIERLNQEKETQAYRIRLFTIFLFGGIISVAIILFLLFKQWQNARIIAAKNQKLERYIEYNMQLENFAYIASHDLKTPLRNIISFTQLLERNTSERLNPEEKKYLGFIESGTREMSLLLDDLLIFSQTNRKQLNLETIPLENFIEELLKKIEVAIKEKQAQINYSFGVSTVTADRVKLGQLLQNLILNGLKFQKPNTQAVIHLFVKESETDWLFQVQDNGIGIDEQYFEKIFLIFKRLHQKSEYDGTGIGLAICKKIIEQHQGKIWVESQKGEGSTFYFTLPKNF